MGSEIPSGEKAKRGGGWVCFSELAFYRLSGPLAQTYMIMKCHTFIRHSKGQEQSIVFVSFCHRAAMTTIHLNHEVCFRQVLKSMRSVFDHRETALSTVERHSEDVFEVVWGTCGHILWAMGTVIRPGQQWRTTYSTDVFCWSSGLFLFGWNSVILMCSKASFILFWL